MLRYWFFKVSWSQGRNGGEANGLSCYFHVHFIRGELRSSLSPPSIQQTFKLISLSTSFFCGGYKLFFLLLVLKAKMKVKANIFSLYFQVHFIRGELRSSQRPPSFIPDFLLTRRTASSLMVKALAACKASSEGRAMATWKKHTLIGRDEGNHN